MNGISIQKKAHLALVKETFTPSVINLIQKSHIDAFENLHPTTPGTPLPNRPRPQRWMDFKQNSPILRLVRFLI